MWGCHYKQPRTLILVDFKRSQEVHSAYRRRDTDWTMSQPPQAQQTVTPYQEPHHSNPKPSTSLTRTNNKYCAGSAAVSHTPYGQLGQRLGSQGPGPEPRSSWCPGRQCEAHPRRHPEPEEEGEGCWSCSLPGACGAAGGGS